MADSTDISDNSSKFLNLRPVNLPEKSDWKKTRNLKKKMNPPLRQLDEFSEEEKRAIVEKNIVKKMGPKLLKKQYHTSQYVIHRFVKSAGFKVFQPQISQKQERILQERQKRFQDLSEGEKSLGKCQNSKTSNHQDQTFPPLSLRNMFVLDEWTNSDSEPKKEIPVKTESQIIDQNCFQDKQQPDYGSEKQQEIKKEPVLELEPESNLPIEMNKGFVFPKPVPSVIPVIKNEPLLDYTTT